RLNESVDRAGIAGDGQDLSRATGAVGLFVSSPIEFSWDIQAADRRWGDDRGRNSGGGDDYGADHGHGRPGPDGGYGRRRVPRAAGAMRWLPPDAGAGRREVPVPRRATPSGPGRDLRPLRPRRGGRPVPRARAGPRGLRADARRWREHPAHLSRPARLAARRGRGAGPGDLRGRPLAEAPL